MIGDGQRIAVAFVAELELALVIGRPQIVGTQSSGERRALGAGPRPRRPRHQSMPIQHGVNRARGWHFDRMREPAQKPLPNLTGSPVRFFPFRCNNRRLHLLGQLVGITERPAGAIAETFQPTRLITFKNLVAGLSRNPEFPAQRSHALPILEPDHKPHSFVHNRAFLPWHPSLPPPFQAKKCNPCLRYVLLPMSQAAHIVHPAHKLTRPEKSPNTRAARYPKPNSRYR